MTVDDDATDGAAPVQWISEVSFIDGGFPLLAAAFGIGGSIGLIATSTPRNALSVVPAHAAGAAVTVAMANVVERLWRPSPDPIPVIVYIWIAIGLFAASLAVHRLWFGRTLGTRSVVAVSAAVVIAFSGSAVNSHFAYHPTVGAVFDTAQAHEIPLLSAPSRPLNPVAISDWMPSEATTNYPSVYPTFLNISGQSEPIVGDGGRTLDAAFEGDIIKFEEIDPLTLLLRSRSHPNGDAFVVGADDRDNNPGSKALRDAVLEAAIVVGYEEIPGAHDFRVWSGGLAAQIDATSHRLGIRR